MLGVKMPWAPAVPWGVRPASGSPVAARRLLEDSRPRPGRGRRLGGEGRSRRAGPRCGARAGPRDRAFAGSGRAAHAADAGDARLETRPRNASGRAGLGRDAALARRCRTAPPGRRGPGRCSNRRAPIIRERPRPARHRAGCRSRTRRPTPPVATPSTPGSASPGCRSGTTPPCADRGSGCRPNHTERPGPAATPRPGRRAVDSPGGTPTCRPGGKARDSRHIPGPTRRSGAWERRMARDSAHSPGRRRRSRRAGPARPTRRTASPGRFASSRIPPVLADSLALRALET